MTSTATTPSSSITGTTGYGTATIVDNLTVASTQVTGNPEVCAQESTTLPPVDSCPQAKKQKKKSSVLIEDEKASKENGILIKEMQVRLLFNSKKSDTSVAQAQMFNFLREELEEGCAFEIATQRHPDWYGMRALAITASEWGAILGVDRYKKRVELLHEKVNSIKAVVTYIHRHQISDELSSCLFCVKLFFFPNSKPASFAMTRGILCENGAVDNFILYMENRQRVANIPDPVTGIVTPFRYFMQTVDGIFRSTVYPWLTATPDAMATVNGESHVVEAKCRFKLTRLCTVPGYFAQMQAQMYVTGARTGSFVQMQNMPPFKTEVTEVPYDASYIADKLPKIIAFADCFHSEIASHIVNCCNELL